MAISLFITSTGTGIGKTFTTCALIRQALSHHLRVEAFKPVISGFADDAIEGSDTAEILDALDREPSPSNVEKISPWRFKAPLSPDMAARAEGQSLDVAALIGFSRQALDSEADVVLIEGVGGVMVPLDDENTVLDWVKALKIPVVLVVGDYLGTISHTLTALKVLRSENIAIAALVLSESGESSVDFDDTWTALNHWAAPTKILALRRGADGAALKSLIE